MNFIFLSALFRGQSNICYMQIKFLLKPQVLIVEDSLGHVMQWWWSTFTTVQCPFLNNCQIKKIANIASDTFHWYTLLNRKYYISIKIYSIINNTIKSILT